MRVFLSYRRGDSAGYTGRLSDTLAELLGPDSVFHDLEAVSAGADFMASIRTALDHSEAVLAVIGPGWVTITDPDGSRRLDDPDDYVRRELVIALGHGIPVVPVLVGGATLPSAEALPDDLRPLLRHQAVVVRDASWRRDVSELVGSLQGELRAGPGRARRSRRWILVAAAAVAVAAVALAAIIITRSGRESPTAADPPLCSTPDLQAATPRPVLADATGTEAQANGALEFIVLEAGVRSTGSEKWQVLVRTRMVNETSDSSYHSYWRYQDIAVGGTPFPVSCYGIVAGADVVLPQLNSEAVVGFDVSKDPTAALTLVVESGLQIPFASAL